MPLDVFLYVDSSQATHEIPNDPESTSPSVTTSMKRSYYLGLLVFSLLVLSALAQGGLRQIIQLDSSTAIAFRSRVQTLSAPTEPRKSPPPGAIAIPPENKLYLYDIVLMDHGQEIVLETIEILRIRDLKSGVYAPFTLLAASVPVANEVVYVFKTDGKFYVATARRDAAGRFHKISRELVAQGINWERAKLKKEDGVVRLYIEGDSKGPKVFERQESGSFVLKSQ